MVAKYENIPDIKKRLRKYIQDFQLSAPFTHLNIKGSTATAILYHNVSFNEILSVISYNQDFYFDERYVVVVSVP